MNWPITTSNEAETQAITDKIVAFNKTQVPLTQTNDLVYFNFHIKDENDFIIAGINSLMYFWGMLYIDILGPVIN